MDETTTKKLADILSDIQDEKRMEQYRSRAEQNTETLRQFLPDYLK